MIFDCLRKRKSPPCQGSSLPLPLCPQNSDRSARFGDERATFRSDGEVADDDRAAIIEVKVVARGRLAPFFVCRPATSAMAIELSRFPRNPTPAVKTVREEYVQ